MHNESKQSFAQSVESSGGSEQIQVFEGWYK